MTTIHTIACPIPFPLKTVNCYYIHDSIPTLIDSGVQTSLGLARIEDGIRQAGGSVERLQRIIVTHAHTDHAGAAGSLALRSGARIYLHRLDYPKFISGRASKTAEYFDRFRQFLHFAGLSHDLASSLTAGFSERVSQLVFPIDDPSLLQGDETFAFDDFQLRVLHTPGHTIGAICLYDRENGALFSGDTLLEKITPNPVFEVNLPRMQKGYCSIEGFRSSLNRLGQFQAVRVLPGHGRAFGPVNARAKAILAHLEKRCSTVTRRMTNGLQPDAVCRPFTLDQLTRSIFAGLEDMTIFLGLSEVYAIIQMLERDGRVKRWDQNGVAWFQLHPSQPDRQT